METTVLSISSLFPFNFGSIHNFNTFNSLDMVETSHTVWREIFTGQNFHGLGAGKDFVKIFRGSTIAKPHLLQEKGVACVVGKISWLKFSRSEVNPRKPQKILSRENFSPYGICLVSTISKHMQVKRLRKHKQLSSSSLAIRWTARDKKASLFAFLDVRNIVFASSHCIHVSVVCI